MQKQYLLQTWRPLTFFLGSNIDIRVGLIHAIRALNGPTISTEIVTNMLFKDNPGLNCEDLRDFGLWLTEQSRVSGKDLQQRLSTMRKRRMIRWHVYQSPSDVVADNLSMHCCFFTN